MTISHPEIPHDADEAFVFAELGLFTCSICAPGDWPLARVIAFAEERFPGRGSALWESIDKSTLGFGSPTPNPCNHAPHRTHYFLMRGMP
jgi:hypothetical protein